MYQDSFSDTQNFLEQVQEGMDVYDRNQERVGKVIAVHFADDTTGSEVPPPSPEDGLGGLEDVIRARLLRSGFIKIGTGLLRSDRFATAEQVGYVDDRGVYLNVEKHDLIKS